MYDIVWHCMTVFGVHCVTVYCDICVVYCEYLMTVCYPGTGRTAGGNSGRSFCLQLCASVSRSRGKTNKKTFQKKEQDLFR